MAQRFDVEALPFSLEAARTRKYVKLFIIYVFMYTLPESYIQQYERSSTSPAEKLRALRNSSRDLSPRVYTVLYSNQNIHSINRHDAIQVKVLLSYAPRIISSTMILSAM